MQKCCAISHLEPDSNLCVFCHRKFRPCQQGSQSDGWPRARLKRTGLRQDEWQGKTADCSRSKHPARFVAPKHRSLLWSLHRQEESQTVHHNGILWKGWPLASYQAMHPQQRTHPRASHLANPISDSVWAVFLPQTKPVGHDQPWRGGQKCAASRCRKSCWFLTNFAQGFKARQYFPGCQFKCQVGWLWPSQSSQPWLCVCANQCWNALLHEPRVNKRIKV